MWDEFCCLCVSAQSTICWLESSCIKIHKGCNTIFASVLLQHFNAVCIQALASDQHPFFFIWCHPLQSGGGGWGGVRRPLSLRQAVSHQFRLAGCYEQQQQHRFLSALTETGGRLRCPTITSATKYLIRNRIQSGVKHTKKTKSKTRWTQQKLSLPAFKNSRDDLLTIKLWQIVLLVALFVIFTGVDDGLPWPQRFTLWWFILLEPTAVNHGWDHATIAHFLSCAERSWVAYRTTALWASSRPHCRPRLLAKIFHYEPFCLRASGAAHYDNHSGRVGYAPCLLCIVLLWWDMVACAG